MYFASVLLDIWPKDKIHSLKNVVCHRKDKSVGTQFLPSPCVLYWTNFWTHFWGAKCPSLTGFYSKQMTYGPTLCLSIDTHI